MSSPTVSVIVITMRMDAAVEAALASVVAQDHRPLEVVLFGNGADVPVPPVLAEAEDVTVVPGHAPENLGVAGGRNAAARLATGEHLVFFDDDAIMRPGALSSAVTTIGSDPRIGAVSFHIIDPTTKATSCWFYPWDRDAWGERAHDVPSVVGGACLIPASVYWRLDGFWEGFFREMEEIDLSWRLLDQGLVIRHDPGAVAEHPDRTKESEVKRRLWRYTVPANVLMLWRLLPFGLALRQTLIKLPLFSYRALRHGRGDELWLGLKTTVRLFGRARRERVPLKPETIRHLRRVYGGKGLGARAQWSLRPLPAAEPSSA